MIDPDRVLRPLEEERAAIDRLTTYENSSELRDALRDAWRSYERSLRLLLRGDPESPDEFRVPALSASALPADRLIQALSSHNLVSVRLAGMAHEFEQGAQRAERGSVRAADADAALAAIAQLRREVRARRDGPVLDAAHRVAETGTLDVDAHAVTPSGGGGGRLVAGLILLLVAFAIALLLLRGRGDGMESGVTAFNTGQHGVAEQEFRRVLEDDRENVTALLYLGRIFRIQGRYEEAADALRDAIRYAPRDAGVRRELGYLFLDLERPESAASQFRIAQELEPENTRNWIGLIRALRAAGDPEAERVLERAPPAVREALTSEPAAPDTL